MELTPCQGFILARYARTRLFTRHSRVSDSHERKVATPGVFRIKTGQVHHASAASETLLQHRAQIRSHRRLRTNHYLEVACLQSEPDGQAENVDDFRVLRTQQVRAEDFVGVVQTDACETQGRGYAEIDGETRGRFPNASGKCPQGLAQITLVDA